jgi:hypothetical protein
MHTSECYRTQRQAAARKEPGLKGLFLRKPLFSL